MPAPLKGIKEHSPLALTRNRTKGTLKTFNSVAKWSPMEDELLIRLVQGKTDINWETVSSHFPNKTLHEVIGRWEKVLDPSLVKGSWTRQEDEFIISWVAAHGASSWTKLAEHLPGRIGKQCRERWHNSLNPQLNKSSWSLKEDEIITEYHQKWGNKWARIAQLLPGRTDNAVKNRWNSTLKKKLISENKLPNEVHEKAKEPNQVLKEKPSSVYQIETPVDAIKGVTSKPPILKLNNGIIQSDLIFPPYSSPITSMDESKLPFLEISFDTPFQPTLQSPNTDITEQFDFGLTTNSKSDESLSASLLIEPDNDCHLFNYSVAYL